jgi:hypothetical protein
VSEQCSLRARSGHCQLDAGRPNCLFGSILDRGRQGGGPMPFAIRRDLCGISLQAIVVRYAIVNSRIVVAAQPEAHEILVLRTISEPISTGDGIHIEADLSPAWQRRYCEQSRCEAPCPLYLQTRHRTWARSGLPTTRVPRLDLGSLPIDDLLCHCTR